MANILSSSFGVQIRAQLVCAAAIQLLLDCIGGVFVSHLSWCGQCSRSGMHTHTRAHMHSCTYSCTPALTHAQTHTRAHMHSCTYPCTHACTYTCTHVQDAQTHTYMHMHLVPRPHTLQIHTPLLCAYAFPLSRPLRQRCLALIKPTRAGWWWRPSCKFMSFCFRAWCWLCWYIGIRNWVSNVVF